MLFDTTRIKIGEVTDASLETRRLTSFEDEVESRIKIWLEVLMCMDMSRGDFSFCKDEGFCVI